MTFQRPQEVDWFRLLSDLDYAGHSNHAVSEICGIPYSTLRDTKGGAAPRHDNGEALCLLYVHILQKPVPRLVHSLPANRYA